MIDGTRDAFRFRVNRKYIYTFLRGENSVGVSWVHSGRCLAMVEKKKFCLSVVKRVLISVVYCLSRMSEE